MSKDIRETCRNLRSVLQRSYVSFWSYIILDRQGTGGEQLPGMLVDFSVQKGHTPLSQKKTKVFLLICIKIFQIVKLVVQEGLLVLFLKKEVVFLEDA